MKFETLTNTKQNRGRPTSSAADQGLITQVVRLKQTTNQNQKMIKTMMKTITSISDQLSSNFDIWRSKNNLE